MLSNNHTPMNHVILLPFFYRGGTHELKRIVGLKLHQVSTVKTLSIITSHICTGVHICVTVYIWLPPCTYLQVTRTSLPLLK